MRRQIVKSHVHEHATLSDEAIRSSSGEMGDRLQKARSCSVFLQLHVSLALCLEAHDERSLLTTSEVRTCSSFAGS
ncbi:hypothetical protein MTO96_032407 [Rhipicephalus appendiculatus]